MDRTIILDNGHGIDTPGKRSPVWTDGTQLFEWEFNRDMVRRIVSLCNKAGIRTVTLVPESYDVSLEQRVARANRLFNRCAGNCVLISIHANAGGGTGFEVFTSKGQTKADELAENLISRLEEDFPTITMRKDLTDGDSDKEENFYILKHTKAPALLVENLFMDNRVDCLKLLDDQFRERLAISYFNFIKTI